MKKGSITSKELRKLLPADVVENISKISNEEWKEFAEKMRKISHERIF